MSDPPCPEWWEDEDVESDARATQTTGVGIAGFFTDPGAADIQAMMAFLASAIAAGQIDVLREDAASKYFFWLGAEALA